MYDPIDRSDRTGPVRLLHVGRIVRTKGLRDTIRALAYSNLAAALFGWRAKKLETNFAAISTTRLASRLILAGSEFSFMMSGARAQAAAVRALL